MLREVDEANVAQHVVVVQKCCGKHRTHLQLLALQADLLKLDLYSSIDLGMIRAAGIRLPLGCAKLTTNAQSAVLHPIICSFTKYLSFTLYTCLTAGSQRLTRCSSV